MPGITVVMFSGRTQGEKDRFAEAVTEDEVKILGVKREDVIIVFQDDVPFPPGQAKDKNWLPSPTTSQPFKMILRSSAKAQFVYTSVIAPRTCIVCHNGYLQ